jgi:hypothetical protein
LSFDFHVFSEEQLAGALANVFITPEEVLQRERSRYLAGYLTEIGARSIVVENDYTDGDYLDDYASYYYSCFEPYPRLCKRLHFFKSSFDEAIFANIVAGKESPKLLKDSYLGFVIARPLPQAVIGRTVLKTYEPAGRRYYPVKRRYEPHLAGIKLEIEGLAFQEQDRVTAACATVALWSAFHMTSKLFHGTRRPRPSHITEAANTVRAASRTLPTHGLDVFQMCEAIRAAHLEPEVIPIAGGTPAASIIYGYLRAKLPVIMICEVEGVGTHAITLNGYSIPSEEPDFSEPVTRNVRSYASRIAEFYGHDDQIGPYAHMFIRKPRSKKEAKKYPFILEGSWKVDGKKAMILPSLLVVPLYEKIRLRYIEMHAWIQRIMSLLVRSFTVADFEWDVHLTTTNGYKSALRDPATEHPLGSDQILLEQQPRFFWKAKVNYKGAPVFEVLGDATDFGNEDDVKHSFPLFRVAWYNDQTRDVFRQFIEDDSDGVIRALWGSKLSLLMSGTSPRQRH